MLDLKLALGKLLPVLLALTAFGALFLWVKRDVTSTLIISNPTPDPRLASAGEKTVIGNRFKQYDHHAEKLPGTWPGFRGPNRDNVVPEGETLADRWPSAGPHRLWEISLGEGHAAPAVYLGRVYILDYDEVKKSDMLRCFSLKDGKELWTRGYKSPMKRNHGFSRTVPAIAHGKIVTIGPRNHVMCTEAVTGEYLWGLDLVADYGSKIPFWYGGQCPLIDGKTVILAVAGKKVLLMGVDLTSGKVLFTTPNTMGIVLSHSSVMPMVVGKTRLYLYAGIGGLVGVGAEGKRMGQTLFWEHTFKASVIAPSPVDLGGGRIHLTAGYGAGSVTFTVSEKDGHFLTEKVKLFATSEALSSEQQTPILYKDRFFSILPKDGGVNRLQLICTDPEDTKTILFKSGKEKRFGLGPYLVADGKLYLLNDDGTLVMIDAEAPSYRELGRAKVIDNGHDAWGPLVIVNGRMLLRDDKRLICLDLSGEE